MFLSFLLNAISSAGAYTESAGLGSCFAIHSVPKNVEIISTLHIVI